MVSRPNIHKPLASCVASHLFEALALWGGFCLLRWWRELAIFVAGALGPRPAWPTEKANRRLDSFRAARAQLFLDMGTSLADQQDVHFRRNMFFSRGKHPATNDKCVTRGPSHVRLRMESRSMARLRGQPRSAE